MSSFEWAIIIKFKSIFAYPISYGPRHFEKSAYFQSSNISHFGDIVPMTLISIYSSFYSARWALSYALSYSSIRCLNLKKFSDPQILNKVSGGNNQKIYLVLVVVGNRLTHHSKALIELILMIYRTFWYDVPFTSNAEVWGRRPMTEASKFICR